MHKNIRWITQTAVMLALLIALQVLSKSMGQLVTGSFVNAILAITVLFAGLSSGITVAILSPILAFLLGIAPQILTVPAIMIANTVFVTVLHFAAGKDSASLLRRGIAWISAAAAKFIALYGIVVWLICDVLAEKLTEAGLLKMPMLKVLTATFSWPQLFTALIGGAVALLITPLLRKALKKQ